MTELAPYAMRAEDSRGRQHQEPEDGVRNPYHRDRDRIVHSAAFRRLAYKTQVFVNHEGDYYRSRLTHTLEVAQVARTIARALKVHEDLTEAVVLAHDLGHTPFGHAGQEVLNELMKDHGGFEHNRQSLRIVDVLERRYLGYRGLNLSYEVRDSILKHGGARGREELGFEGHRQPLIEGQIADLADSIAYDQHDVDDALKAGLIRWDDLRDLALWRRALEHCERRRAELGPRADDDPRVLRREAVRFLIGLLVNDLIATTTARIAERGIAAPEDVRGLEGRVVALSPELAREKAEFQRFLHARVYRHYRMARMAGKARRFIALMFEEFCARPEQLPPEYRDWVGQVGVERGVCDYIAGMTDRYAQREVLQLTKPFIST